MLFNRGGGRGSRSFPLAALFGHWQVAVGTLKTQFEYNCHYIQYSFMTCGHRLYVFYRHRCGAAAISRCRSCSIWLLHPCLLGIGQSLLYTACVEVGSREGCLYLESFSRWLTLLVHTRIIPWLESSYGILRTTQDEISLDLVICNLKVK